MNRRIDYCRNGTAPCCESHKAAFGDGFETGYEFASPKRANLGDVVHFAFRYSLGRRTYAPSAVIQFLLAHMELIDKRQLAQIAIEIAEADERNGLGSEHDRELWLQLRQILEEEVYDYAGTARTEVVAGA